MRPGTRADTNWRERQQMQRNTWRNADRDAWRDGNRNTWRNNGQNSWRNDRSWRGDRNRYANPSRNWNRDWRRDNRYDWHSYRNSNRHVYRLGRYQSPYRNWSYRRLSIGFALSPSFYASSYWIGDPWSYRLPPAHGPYRWVRYFDDALLVDIHTGEVVDVIHDIFW